MSSPILRPVRLAVCAGLIALGGSAAEAGNFGTNLNVRMTTPNLPQMELVGVRHSNISPVTTPPPPVYQGPDRRPHSHAFDPNTQFDGMGGDNSANGKLPK